ncbi:MAG: hypothetical protein R3E58_04185 [Phycisphaerae bacterium]
MNNKDASHHDKIDAAAIAERQVELDVLLGIEKLLRIAIDWEVKEGSPRTSCRHCVFSRIRLNAI